MKWARFD